MDSRTTTKIRKVIEPKEFKKILLENETFILHLTAHVEKNPSYIVPLSFIPKRKKLLKAGVDPFELWLGYVDINYFEMEMKDAVDIMLEFGYGTNYIITTIIQGGEQVTYFYPAMLLIHKGRVFYNTQSDCYCIESMTENILKLDRNLIILPD